MEIKLLKDVCSISKGQQINGDDLLKKGDYKFFNGGINASGYWNEYNVKENSISISEGGNSCGYVNYQIEPFWCGAHCYYLYDLKVSSKYLYYYLKYRQSDLMAIRSGVCMPNIKKKDLENFKINLKSIDKQHDVINTLEKIESLIQINTKKLEKFDEIVKSQFIEMFGDVFYNDNGYKLVKIGDVVKYEQPTKYIVSSEDYNESFKIPVLTAGKSFILGYTDENDGIFYGSKEKVVIFDDFTCDSKIVDFDFKVKSSAMKLLHMTKDINVDFFYHALKQNHYNVANHKRHWISVFEIMEMGLPPIEEQNEFSKFLQQIDKSKFIVQKQIKLLEELLEKKMNEYFGQ